MKKEILFMILIFLIIPLINSSIPNLGYFEHGKDIELRQTCTINGTFCDYCNISSVDYPNGSRIISDVSMTKRSADFNYTLDGSYTQNIIGTYKVNGYCKFGDDVIKNWVYYFDVTINGREPPEGVTIVVFVIIFLILLAMITGLVLYTVGKVVEQEFNLWDLIYNISAFFVILGVYFFGREYLGNSFFNTFLVTVISITSITNVFFPLIAFILAITIWKWKELENW